MPTFALAGKLTREYLLPPSGQPRLDSPGGDLLYAAGGLAVWDMSIGLISKVDPSYPQEWVDDLSSRGMDVHGIHRDDELTADMRSFIAYTEANERSHSNPVSHFARRQATFPKSLLGYQSPGEMKNPLRDTDTLSPDVLRIPKGYRNIRFAHIGPFDFTSQNQVIGLFKGGEGRFVSLDPDPGYMKPDLWRGMRMVLIGVNAFLPSEEELRSLFWGETNDLWEMAQTVSNYGPETIVIKRGSLGQYVYDSAAKKRYEIPAYPARLVDPTGAGSAFCGGFLSGYGRTNDPFMAALHGNVSASLKIEGIGPFATLDAMPGLADARLQALKEMAREI